MNDEMNGQLFQSQPVKSDEIYANIMQDERIKNTLSQTSPDNLLSDIEFRIRGYKKNIFSGQWEKTTDTKINDKLINRFISFLGSILNDNTRFANLAGSEINSIMKLCIEYIADDFDTHAEEYGLTSNYTERTRISYIMLNTIFIVLKRAENGMESRRVWGTLTLNEVNNPFQNNQKKSIFDKIKSWVV